MERERDHGRSDDSHGLQDGITRCTVSHSLRTLVRSSETDGVLASPVVRVEEAAITVCEKKTLNVCAFFTPVSARACYHTSVMQVLPCLRVHCDSSFLGNLHSNNHKSNSPMTGHGMPVFPVPAAQSNREIDVGARICCARVTSCNHIARAPSVWLRLCVSTRLSFLVTPLFNFPSPTLTRPMGRCGCAACCGPIQGGSTET